MLQFWYYTSKGTAAVIAWHSHCSHLHYKQTYPKRRILYVALMNAYSSNSQIVRTCIACTIKNPHQRMLSLHTWHDDIVRINVTNFHPLILAIIHTCNMFVVHKTIYCNMWAMNAMCTYIFVCYLEQLGAQCDGQTKRVKRLI